MNPARLPTIVLTDHVYPGEAAEMASMLLKAKARFSDPDTSHEAASSVLRLTKRRMEVLSLFSRYGSLTDEELAAKHANHPELLKQSVSGLRTRRAELVAMSLVQDTGLTRTNQTGRKCIVWDATNPGVSV